MKALQERVVLRAVHCGDLERLLQLDEQITGQSRRDWFERRLNFVPGDVRFSLGAEVDGALVGAVLGSLRNGELGSAEPICVIDAVLVDRPFRGRGVAAVLLRRLAENLSGLGVSRWRMKVAWKLHALDYFLGDKGFLLSPRPPPERRRAESARASF
jgi:GNAT superfamily N-acetyltransferase